MAIGIRRSHRSCSSQLAAAPAPPRPERGGAALGEIAIATVGATS